MPSKKGFPCNTCNLIFEDSPAQRKHMREPWHVYNLKRRVAELPPISVDEYSENVATTLVSSKQEPLNAAHSSEVVKSLPQEKLVEETHELEDSDGEEAQTNRCLFCMKTSEHLESNLEHMSSEHGLHIPEIEQLSSLEAIVNYLRTVISKYNECLYCGMIKQSAEGIRRHMMDKGHCMINLEREPELLEFWELSDTDENDTDDEDAQKPGAQKPSIATPRDLLDGEYTLPSGKIIGSKNKAREARLFARRSASAAKENSSQAITEGSNENTALTSSANPAQSLIKTQEGNQGRAVSTRDAVGLVGVSDQQVRSLITIHRKAQRQQALVHASAAWAGELGGTHQKHYKQKMRLRDG